MIVLVSFLSKYTSNSLGVKLDYFSTLNFQNYIFLQPKIWLLRVLRVKHSTKYESFEFYVFTTTQVEKKKVNCALGFRLDNFPFFIYYLSHDIEVIVKIIFLGGSSLFGYIGAFKLIIVYEKYKFHI